MRVYFWIPNSRKTFIFYFYNYFFMAIFLFLKNTILRYFFKSSHRRIK
ncbi:hypothetical protein TSAR_005347 [Trichomalopsis sarcophagae]|uniref:Uncharacterized protein n=1 Tax=Trichomalopsis sarcophagae TaxID=543379 RepID=A0A232FBG3_9HYME|nr:hypothetical protein TSAR_005347 [Trichomalopsis sarcophagae]